MFLLCSDPLPLPCLDLLMAATCAGLGVSQQRLICELRQAAASAGHRATSQEVRGMQRLDAVCLRVLRKVYSMSQDKPFIWKTLKTAWVGPKAGWGWASGYHHNGAKWCEPSLWTQIWHCLSPLCVCVEGEWSAKEQWPLSALMSCRKLPHQLSPLCQIIQFLPVCLWCLLSCCPNAITQRKWISVSLCMGCLRGTAWAPDEWLRWLEHSPIHQKVVGSNPGQAHTKANRSYWLIFLPHINASFSLSLPLSLKSIKVSMDEDLKKECMGLRQHSVTVNRNFHWSLQPRVMGDFSSWSWNPWLGDLVWGWGFSLRGHLCSWEIPLEF